MYFNEKLKECKEYLRGMRVSVIGVGISNIPLLNFLIDNGAYVTARDKKSIEEISKNKNFDYEGLIQKKVKFITGEDYLANLCEDIVFKTPGIRYDVPEILQYAENGGIVTSEMELFLYMCPSKIFAVTGSDGKTTTTTLIAKLLETTGKNVFLGGNIGKPLLCEIENITPDDFTVLELSSFQLHAINRFANKKFIFSKINFPDVAVITNISPNHLNWHTDMNEYIQAKHAVFDFLRKDGKLVTNLDCKETKEIADEEKQCGITVEAFSLSGNKTADYYYENGFIIHHGKKILSREDILLVGNHNVDNYMTAIAATSGFVSKDGITRVAKSFGGVEHRIELVREKDGVKYYNSSIDSTPSRTAVALESFGNQKNIIIILGGYDKNIPFEPLCEPLLKHVKAAFLTGNTADKIEKALKENSSYKVSDFKLIKCDNWDSAMKDACLYAKSGDVVLLSPACASFDAFRNFEERGIMFKNIVNSL